MAGFKGSGMLFIKGMAMGAVDVVPGVSGGTVAFITGIYEELIETLSRFNPNAIRILFKSGIKEFWTYINGRFLFTLLSGIALSIITLAKVITFLLETYPIAVWAFFFGLVAASVPIIVRTVREWKPYLFAAFFIGAVLAFLLTELPVISNPELGWYLFLSGLLAICALLLPGISGSFVLLLMGTYLTVLEAVNNRDIAIIAVFGAGCITGLLGFSHVLKILFKRFYDLTVAVMSGFLLGSLNKIWPWKNPIDTFVKHQGTAQEKVVVITEENVMPWHFAEITGEDAHLWLAIALALFGFLFTIGIDRIASRKAKA